MQKLTLKEKFVWLLNCRFPSPWLSDGFYRLRVIDRLRKLSLAQVEEWAKIQTALIGCIFSVSMTKRLNPIRIKRSSAAVANCTAASFVGLAPRGCNVMAIVPPGDISECRCLRVIAGVTEPDGIQTILAHLKQHLPLLWLTSGVTTRLNQSPFRSNDRDPGERCKEYATRYPVAAEVVYYLPIDMNR